MLQFYDLKKERCFAPISVNIFNSISLEGSVFLFFVNESK